MPNVYVEARSEGQPVVDDHADHVLGTFKTQVEFQWARKPITPAARRVCGT